MAELRCERRALRRARKYVLKYKGERIGALGAEQITWLKQDLAGQKDSTPVVVFAPRVRSGPSTPRGAGSPRTLSKRSRC